MMSQQSNQIILVWEDVVSKIRRHTLRHAGKVLSAANKIVVEDAIALCVVAWYDLFNSRGYQIELSQLPIWADAIASCDVDLIFRTLKLMDDILLSSCEEQDEFISVAEGFKHLPLCEDPTMTSIVGLFLPLVEAWDAFRDPEDFSALHCSFAFIGRVNLSRVDSLEARALEGYLDTEYRLGSMLPSLEGDIISKWFPRSNEWRMYEDWSPRHGPGSVAEGTRDWYNKYQYRVADARLHHLLLRVDEGLDWSRGSANRTTKVIFVPKSTSTYRTISSEPSFLMWMQQGLLNAWLTYLRDTRHYLLRRFDLRRESDRANDQLAWEGSIGGRWATIDLSSASDSVSWSLVKTWFRRSALYRGMLATRSELAKLPDGTEMSLKKFAPMGSALCFPTECIVFSAIVEAALVEMGVDPATSSYRVYGDDIVVEAEYAQSVMDRLQRLGFIVNRQKSFYRGLRSFFRESCGGEYLDGHDVAPIRLSRRFSGLPRRGGSPSSIVSACDLANDTFVRLPSVRRVVVRSLNQLPPDRRVRFDDTGTTGIFSVAPTNHSAPHRRWNQELQRNEVKLGTVAIRSRPRQESDESILLYEWLRRTRYRSSLDHPDQVVVVERGTPGAPRWQSSWQELYV